MKNAFTKPTTKYFTLILFLLFWSNYLGAKDTTFVPATKTEKLSIVKMNPLPIVLLIGDIYLEHFIKDSVLSTEFNITFGHSSDTMRYTSFTLAEAGVGLRYYPFYKTKYLSGIYIFSGLGYTYNKWGEQTKRENNRDVYYPKYDNGTFFSRSLVGYQFIKKEKRYGTDEKKRTKYTGFSIDLGIGLKYFFEPFLAFYSQSSSPADKRRLNDLPAVQIAVGYAF